MVCVGAMLGRKYYLPFGHAHVYCNLYAMLMGEAGARKTSAIVRAKELLALTGYRSFAPTKTTREKFLLDLDGRELDDTGKVDMADLKDDFDPNAPRESFIVADEFNIFIGIRNVNFIDTLGAMWDWSSSTPFEDKVKNSRSVSITDPTISILGGNTPVNFATAFPPEILGQGFFSRLLLVHGEKTGKKFTIPPPPDLEIQAALVDMLTSIRNEAFGKVTISAEAMAALDYIYQHDDAYTFDDTRFASYNNRRFMHMLKLSLLHAAMDCSKTLSVEHVIQGNTVLAYTERFMPQALGEFGKNRNSDIANAVMQLLLRHDRPVTHKEIWAAVSQDLSKPEDLRQILLNLESAGKLKIVEIPVKDGREVNFVPVRKVSKSDQKFVDFSLLSKEEQRKVIV